MTMELATCSITGRIGTKKRFGKTLKVTLANNWYNSKTKAEEVNWNTVTFIGKDADHVEEHFPEGSLLTVRGRIGDSSYEKDGETVYTVERTVLEFELLSFPKRDNE